MTFYGIGGENVSRADCMYFFVTTNKIGHNIYTKKTNFKDDCVNVCGYVGMCKLIGLLDDKLLLKKALLANFLVWQRKRLCISYDGHAKRTTTFPSLMENKH